ncbi:MAG: tRNA uracil 4-sulfurtransferase ThiI [Patescibacteria group bacterium]|nr:tRNA uracil 4-sulfurtransferase ThiI [Patescibacteria group bacterium]
MKCIVCHYGEIALKGKNRRFFEERLVSNIRKVVPEGKVSSPRGRIVILTEKENTEEKIKKIPGINYLFVAEVVSSEKDEIIKKAVSLMSKGDYKTFRVTVKRADKSFSILSSDFASQIGAEVVKATGKKVNLSNPEKTCYIEITKKETYIYTDKIKGLGGLPIGTGGVAVSLLSGGIDSPVASFRMIKRGVKNIFVHFHAYPTTSKQSQEKVERIVKILSGFQGESVLFLVPFDEIQKEVVLNTSDKTRVLLYRRFMARIAEVIAKKEGAKAVITGESLGQVASQTVENITVMEDALSLPVFRPLIGHDKEEIIREAEELGSYDISILPEEDCCVRFLPKNPQTKGKIKEVEKEEEKIDIKKMIDKALKGVIKKVIKNEE